MTEATGKCQSEEELVENRETGRRVQRLSLYWLEWYEGWMMVETERKKDVE